MSVEWGQRKEAQGSLFVGRGFPRSCGEATPNPHIVAMLHEEGFGPTSSLAELVLCERCGVTGEDIMFTSNDALPKIITRRWSSDDHQSG